MRPADLPPAVVNAKFESRGPILRRAQEIEHEIEEGKGSKYPFKTLIKCNLGNPLAVGMKPFSFNREVLALATAPHLLGNINFTSKFNPDVVARARLYHDVATGGKGVGSYAPSTGYPLIRKRIADFITRRDRANASEINHPRASAIPASSADSIVMANGTTSAIVYLLQMLLGDDKTRPAVLGPCPNYPLYTALTTIQGAHMIGYDIDEAADWTVHIESLEQGFKAAKARGVRPVVLQVISPGNPTGSIFSREKIKEIIAWCISKDLCLIADEVYQGNVFLERDEGIFHSFREVLFTEFPPEQSSKLRLLSVHSVSKETGECGLRGGYVECTNVDNAVMQQLTKLAAISLAPNSIGQLAMDLQLWPPVAGDASYERHKAERDVVNSTLKHKAEFVTAALNKIPLTSTNRIAGAFYAFPTIRLPRGFVDEAKRKQRAPDFHWTMLMLEKYGVLTVPGKGFIQKAGTYHFRTTILPAEKDLKYMIESIGKLQRSILAQYGDDAPVASKL